MLINIGYGNLVNPDKLIAVVSPEAAPVKRLVQHARENNQVIDATAGRRTKAVLVMEADRVVLSALVPDTIARRVSGRDSEAWRDGSGPNREEMLT